MVANNAQLVGIRKYVNQEDPARSSTTLYFAYQDQYVEGTATVSFTLWNNSRNIDPNSLVLKDRYNLFFYRRDKSGYYTLDSIQHV